jgi:peptidoglycan-N-acetylglucosamine deacetylase
MNRRQFSKTFGWGAFAIGLSGINTTAQKNAPQFSITMDDFSWRNAVKLTAAERNEAILQTLAAHSIKAALFVIGRNIEVEEGKQLLDTWDKAGHLIGNHTYSHRSLNWSTTSLSEYTEDILRAEALLKDYTRFRKYFRFPMLKEGDTAQKRDGVRTFLSQHGYRVGHVTIDDSDWAIDQRLTARLTKDATADVKPYRDYYLEHIWDRARYYDSLSQRVVGRSVKHTILVHYNLLNGLFLDELIQMFRKRGWQQIDAEEAFTDAVFSAQPKVLPAGESIVWALAKEKGTIAKSLRYPAEDGEYETARMNRLGL